MCGRVETGDEKEERRLREIVSRMEQEIITQQGLIVFYKGCIKRLQQKNCPHLPQSGDDGGNIYCSKCGKKLE
jgi:hypothetical protein